MSDQFFEKDLERSYVGGCSAIFADISISIYRIIVFKIFSVKGDYLV